VSVYPQYITEANIDAINEDGIANWEKCRDITLELDELPGYSEDIYQRNALMRRYCNYRIASYKLIVKASINRKRIVFRKIEEYNKTIGFIARKLKGEVIADNLLRYKAPEEPKFIIRDSYPINTKPKLPMYIVDGKIMTDMSSINPANIKNVNVMKGAAAKAVYGAEGANGVVIVTTK
jgi:TonB-dependent SusC/RagA subfamily outer membrane receptor